MILRVRRFPKTGSVVSAAILGVSFGNGHTAVSHLPFSESAVELSVVSLERETGSVPDAGEGYRAWRKDFDAGHVSELSTSVTP